METLCLTTIKISLVNFIQIVTDLKSLDLFCHFVTKSIFYRIVSRCSHQEGDDDQSDDINGKKVSFAKSSFSSKRSRKKFEQKKISSKKN
jgi:hypothetical protein